jgi:hypothetical protein
MSNKLTWIKAIVPLRHCPQWQQRIDSSHSSPVDGRVVAFVVCASRPLFFSTLNLQQHQIKNSQMLSSYLSLALWYVSDIKSRQVWPLGWGVETKQIPKGRAIAQAVRRRLPTAAARFQIRVWSCGILWWTKVALGKVFSENFGFPCQSTFHLLLHNHLHYHPRLAQ